MTIANLLIALEGNNQRQFASNRIPLNTAVRNNASHPYVNEDLLIPLPNTANGQAFIARDVKWFSVWCSAFGLSFGDVKFNLKAVE